MLLAPTCGPSPNPTRWKLILRFALSISASHIIVLPIDLIRSLLDRVQLIRSPSIAGRSAMADRPFVHLHCHSHYSLLDGASRIPELVEQTQEAGDERRGDHRPRQPLRGHRVLPRGKAADIKPIIGFEAYVAPGSRTERTAGGARATPTST